MNTRNPKTLHVWIRVWSAVAALCLAGAAGNAAERTELARVVGIVGSALAQSPGEAPRDLDFDSPVYAGDKLVTAGASGLGLLAGSHYVGLDEATTAVLRATDAGAPDVFVERGRARVLDSGDGAAARLATRGLVAANAGPDSEAFAFAEKAGLVSMICPNEGSVTAGGGGNALTPSAGQCAVSKAGEPLFAAKAGVPPLGLLAGPQGFNIAGAPQAPLPPVALGLAALTRINPALDPFGGDPRLPCDGGGCAGALNPIPNPPTNPPQVGGAPP